MESVDCKCEVDSGCGGSNAAVWRHPPWDLLTDDIWARIIGKLSLRDKLAMQSTSQMFHGLLARPVWADTWGRLGFSVPKTGSSADVSQRCSWVQQRLKGISALDFHWEGEGRQQLLVPEMWHALVAVTAGTGIRLRLSGGPFPPCNLLQTLVCSELVQRLTALHICVADAEELAAVYSLAALRHLRLWSPASTSTELFMIDDSDSTACTWRLFDLRTLQLIHMPPAALFTVGTAAHLQQLHSLRLVRCPLPLGVLPRDILRLPSLSRLELLQLPLRMMPDLRGLLALQTLVVCAQNGGLDLDASQAECSAELRAALRENPLGGAMGLRNAVLQGMSILSQQCAEAVERLPHLEVLGLEFSSAAAHVCWAARLQQRMQGRCSVRPAAEFVRFSEGKIVFQDKWPDDDW